mmetsp:Transcript_17836/g.17164  ORF Transcript_17836/g.17164 Transcript_17836/m.17164 type:complete len:534 (-) Transcript_17836:225-1826(-)|eukprot:CAMPEP_0119034526 /NCGR_PEP_ID=MMETSP1177-20130426/1507_1 /TAXON_ID=2985 /ORGANISM="Ochromonas sp, Strain CCMP1899" /LENGTH=533 /DNA_ID=CAMNT_0006992005 /DNA_START=194 /DNA_END=1795 /DNA_ORIENTATION=+
MGAAASAFSHQDLSNDEKTVITKVLQEKYHEIREDEKTKNASEIEIFGALSTLFAAEAKKIMDTRVAEEEGEDIGPLGLGPVSTAPMLGKMARQASANNLGDKQGDGTTFTFALDEEQQNADPSARQYTSTELIDALKAGDAAALDDQDKISSFISNLKNKDETGAKPNKASAFRKKRLTYEHIPSAGDKVKETSSQKKDVPVPMPKQDKVKPKRTTIFSSSEIGVRQDKKPPFVSSLMGTFSCHGIEPGEDEDGEDAVHDKINQDRGCVVYPYRSSEDEALFMVLDGHGEQGDRISEFVMRQIVISLEKHPSLTNEPPAALLETFVKTNTALMVTPMNYMTSGCTCVAVYMKGKTLYVANSGDSRAVMACDSGGPKLTAKDLSRDHKPDDADEMARIKQWGGFVSPAPDPGLSARVYLDAEFTMIGLAMSRSIGDYAVKAVGVIPDPETFVFELEKVDRFMILASDGVWEFITSGEAVDIVQKSLSGGADCDAACQVLIETAAKLWQREEGDYRDDITAIVVRFPLPHQAPF